MAVSYLDVGGIKSMAPYMAAFANALGQRLSPSGREATSYYRDPKKWVDTAKQGWKKKTPPSVKKEYGNIIFKPGDSETFYFENDKTIPDWGRAVEIDPATRAMPSMNWEAMADLPSPGPSSYPMQNPTDIGALMRRPPAQAVGMPYVQLDAGTPGNSIFDLMNAEQALNDGEHYPAILKQGEEVINPEASEVFRPLLQQINQAVPGTNPTAPPVMDMGTEIEEQRRQQLSQRGRSPRPPMRPPVNVPPQTTAGRPPIVPMPTDPRMLQLLQNYGLTAPAQPVPTTPIGQAEEARKTGYAPLRRERYTPPRKLDKKKMNTIEKAAEIISDELMSAREHEAKVQKQTAKGVKKAAPIPPPPPPPPQAQPAPFKPGWNMTGQPMNIDWKYIQSLPTMQAQAVLQQYADMQQMPMQSLQAHRAGVGPGMQRQQLMQGLMGQYKGGAEMPGVKGEAAYSAEKGKRAGDIISADIDYKKGLTFQANLRDAVVNEVDPEKAGKLRQLELANQQKMVDKAATRAKEMGGVANRDWQKEFVKLQVLMNPNIALDDIMRGLPKPATKLFSSDPKERQKNTLTEQEVIEIIAEFGAMGMEGSMMGQAKKMGAK